MPNEKGEGLVGYWGNGLVFMQDPITHRMKLIESAFNDSILKEIGFEIGFYYSIEHTCLIWIFLEAFESCYPILSYSPAVFSLLYGTGEKKFEKNILEKWKKGRTVPCWESHNANQKMDRIECTAGKWILKWMQKWKIIFKLFCKLKIKDSLHVPLKLFKNNRFFISTFVFMKN